MMILTMMTILLGYYEDHPFGCVVIEERDII